MSEKKTYNYDQVYEATLKYFKGDELATTTWIKKYCLRDGETAFYELTPDDSHRRYAKEFARVEYAYLNTIKNKSIDVSDLSDVGRKRFEKIKDYSIKELEDHFYSYLKDYKYIIPSGSVMENLGANRPVSNSNCFFNGRIEDNVEDILKTALSMAQVGKRRGGSGTDISNLRPKDAFVDNSAKVSSGAVDWMQLFDTIGKIIGQSARKMAMIISIDVNHPDVRDFIKCKQNTNAITNANISIKFNKAFMKAVEEEKDYLLRFPVDYKGLDNINIEDYEYDKLYKLKEDEKVGKVYIKRVNAKSLWDEFVFANRNFAEPGFFNWERVIDYDPSSVYEELMPLGTNPCGELPLGKHDSCRLISSNLYSMVDNPFVKDKTKFNLEKAEEVFYETQVMCDLIVDLELESLDRIISKLEKENKNIVETDEIKQWKEIRRNGYNGRRTGTGFTALGDMLAALYKPYGEPTQLEEIMKLKFTNELNASIDLAKIKGAFPLYNFNKEYHTVGFHFEGTNEWFEMLIKDFPELFEKMRRYGRRNIGISTLAPNGTLSIMTQTTSGVEPIFMPFYTRRRVVTPGENPDFYDENGKGFKEFVVTHHKLREFVLANPELAIPNTDFLDYKTSDWQHIYEQSPYYQQTANDINWEHRVQTQGLIQKYITSSISSTINLPKTTTVEEVDKIYRDVFKYKLKGCTIYRDSSRSGVLVSTDKKEKDTCDDFVTHSAPKRPKTLDADFYKVKYKGQTYIIIIGLYCDKPYELFCFIPTLENIELNQSFTKIKEHRGTITKVKKNLYKFESDFITIPNLTEFNSDEEERHCTRTSLELRHGIDLKYIIKTFKKYDDNITSFSSVSGRILNKYVIHTKEETDKLCPDCGEKLVHGGGCIQCVNCSYSKCS